MGAGALLLIALPVFALRTLGVVPRQRTAAVRARIMRMRALVPVWLSIGYLSLSVGAFVTSHDDWWVLVALACFGLSQVGFFAWSQRQARRRAARRSARAAPGSSQ